MLLENEFRIPTSADRLWAYLLDVERLAPCVPGAELTEVVDDRTFKGRVAMKLGPVSLSFAGTVTVQERDDSAHRVVLHAKGLEQKGKGAANVVLTAWLEPGEGFTTVAMRSEITLTGTVAQVSRGLLPDVSAKLTQQFADCLRDSMSALEREGRPDEAPAPPPRRRAIGGIRLGLFALARAVARFFHRLLGPRSA
jgi:hypothetical protein